MKGSRSVIKEKIIPIASHVLLTAINLYCLIIYFTNVTEKNLLDLGYVAYLTMLGNGLIGLTKFSKWLVIIIVLAICMYIYNGVYIFQGTTN